MPSFRDSKSREWEVNINVLTLRIVREKTGFEIGKINPGNVDGLLDNLNNFILDTKKFTSVLYVLVKAAQPLEAIVTLEDFLEGLDGPCLEAARTAFMEAFIFFSPSPVRKFLQEVLKAEEIKDRAATALVSVVNLKKQEFVAEMDREVGIEEEKIRSSILKLAAGRSLELSGSMPALELSAS